MLIGAKTALVPLGLSCQPAHQIEEHRALAETLCGENLRRRTGPFDWRIAGLCDIAGMIEDGEYSPRDANEIWLEQQDDPPGSGRPATKRYWARRRCWFWHETQRSHLVFSLKQAHLARNFARLAGVERRIFFVSNLQNNLAPLAAAGNLDLTIARDQAVRVWRALDNRFGACSLHVVTSRELALGFAETGEPGLPIHLHFAAPGAASADWKGDSRIWESVLRKAIPSHSSASAH
jgi:hypothetical protein